MNIKLIATLVGVGALLIGIPLILYSAFNKGEKAGTAKVESAVQKEASRATQQGVQRKDKADDEVSKTPYKTLVDGLD